MSVQSGQAIAVLFTTRVFATGVGTNADSLPTGTLYQNGTANAATVTITNLATGLYKAAVTLPTLAIGDEVELIVSATVSSVADKAVVWGDTNDIAVDGSGNASANVTKLLGTAWLTPGTAGTPDVNVKQYAGQAAAVGSDNLPKVGLWSILGSALTEAVAGYLAAAFKKFFNIATPTLTTGGTDQTGDSYARIGANGAGLSSLAPAATALSNVEWTNALATAINTLAGHDPGSTLATSASQTSILNAVGAITTNTARTGITVPQFVALPASGTSVVRVKVKLFNLQGALEDADTNTVTVHASNAAGTSLDANLSATTAVRDSAGQYHVDYTVHAADAEGGVYIAVTYTVGGVSMAADAVFAVAQADTVTSIASILSGVNTITGKLPSGNIGDATAANQTTIIGDIGGLGSPQQANTAVTLPSVAPANWIAATSVAAAALNGKGDWLLAANYTAPPTAAQNATAFWTDTNASDFATAGTPGKILVGQLGGAFTTTASSVFTVGALANAPAGGGGGGDPWATLEPGSYGQGTFGYLVSRNLDVAVSSRLAASSYQAEPLPMSLVNSSIPANTPFTKTFTQGDLRTNIADVLIDATGTPINLTGSTVAFRMIAQADKSVKVNSAAANLDDAPNGKVSYTWQSTDLDTAGLYWGWWIVTTGGKTEHFPGDGEKMTVKVVASE